MTPRWVDPRWVARPHAMTHVGSQDPGAQVHIGSAAWRRDPLGSQHARSTLGSKPRALPTLGRAGRAGARFPGVDRRRTAVARPRRRPRGSWWPADPCRPRSGRQPMQAARLVVARRPMQAAQWPPTNAGCAAHGSRPISRQRRPHRAQGRARQAGRALRAMLGADHAGSGGFGYGKRQGSRSRGLGKFGQSWSSSAAGELWRGHAPGGTSRSAGSRISSRESEA